MGDRASFYVLPEEILIEIADAVSQRPFPSIADLKALRLSGRRLSYLDRILKYLFSTIRFVANPQHVERFIQGKIDRLIPFVKEITFVAPHPNWTASFKEFEQTVRSHLVMAHVEGRRSQMQYSLPEYSDDQIRECYDLFRQQALATKTCFYGAQLKEIWTSTLQTMQGTFTVRLESSQYADCVGEYLPESPNRVLQHGGHLVQFHWRSDVGGRLAAAGDDLFATVIACLAAAKAKPKDLMIGCAMSGKLDWPKLKGWKEVDLSQLRNLNISSIYSHDPVQYDANTEREGRNVNEVFKKTVSSLMFFSQDVLKFALPCNPTVAPPKLVGLTIGGGTLHPRELGAWITRLTSLESFKMSGGILGPYTDWFFIFSAIRDHANRMCVEFDQIITNEAAESSVRVSTNEYFGEEVHNPACHGHDYEYLWGHANKCLEFYLCKRSGYTHCLEHWFEGTEWDDSSEEDSSEEN